MIRDKEPVKTPEDKFDKLKDSIVAGYKFTEEGNKCLQTVLKRKSFEDIGAVQALFAAGNKNFTLAAGFRQF